MFRMPPTSAATEAEITAEPNGVVPEVPERSTLQVIDALGQVVIAKLPFEREVVLDLQAMTNGTYIVSVTRQDGAALKNFTLFKRSTH